MGAWSCLVAFVRSDARSKGRKGDLPKVTRRANEFDAHRPSAVFGGLEVDDTAFLMFRGAPIYQTEHLAPAHAASENHKPAIGVDRKHLRGFAKGFRFAFEHDHFDWHNQSQPLAAAMRPPALPNLDFRWIHEARE